MTFKIDTTRIPADDSFWYRLALLDVQQALINATTTENAEAFDEVFDGLKTAWEELFAQQQQVRLAVEATS